MEKELAAPEDIATTEFSENTEKNSDNEV